MLLVAGCTGVPGIEKTPDPSAARAAVVGAASAQIGIPYRYDGFDRTGFDAAGLARFAYAQAGFAIPGQAPQQLRIGEPIGIDQVRPGDLLFYRLPELQEFEPLHVGVYIGSGEMVHAIADRDEVVVESIDSAFWQDRLAAVIAVLP